MTKSELKDLIRQANHHLHSNWEILTPHKRDHLKHQIKLLKRKLYEN